jgi:hypothetical protein
VVHRGVTSNQPEDLKASAQQAMLPCSWYFSLHHGIVCLGRLRWQGYLHLERLQ